MEKLIKYLKTLCLCAFVVALSSCLPENNRSSSGSSSLDTQNIKSQQYASDMLSSAAEIQVAVTQDAQWAAGTFPVGQVNFAALGIGADVAANISAAHCRDAAGTNQILVWMTAPGAAAPAGGAAGRFALKGLGNNAGPMIAQKLSGLSGASVGLFDGQSVQLSAQNMGGQTQMQVPAGCNINIPVGAPVMVMEGSNAGAALVTAGATSSFEYQNIDCPAGQAGSITQRREISIDPVTFARTAIGGWANFNSNCNNAVQGFNVAVTQGSAAAMNYAQLGGGLSSILDTLAQIDCRNIQGNTGAANGTRPTPNDINFQGGTVTTGNAGQTLSSSCDAGQGTVISVGSPEILVNQTGNVSDQDTRAPMDCPPGDLNPYGSVVPAIIAGVSGTVDVGVGWEGINGITFRRLYFGAQDQQGQIFDERNFWQGDDINCTRDEILSYSCSDVFAAYNNPPYTQTNVDGFTYTRQNQINGWANPQTFIANPPLGINVGWAQQPPSGCGWDERYSFTNCEPGFTPLGQGQYSRPLVANQITDTPAPGGWVPENPSICQNTQVTYLPCPFGFTGNIERTTGFESRADYPATPDVAGGPTATPTVTQISQVDVDNCVCDPSIYEEQQMACSGGQVGIETQRRYNQCPGGGWGPWQTHTTTCSAPAACGTANGQTLIAPPSTPGEYCSVGAGSGLISNASGYLWTCTDTVTGSQANCSANRALICSSPTAIICLTDADCGGAPGSCNGGCCGPNPPLCPAGAAGLCPTGAQDGDPCLGIANHECQSNCCVPVGGPDCSSVSSATLGDPGAGSPIFLPDGTIGDDIGYPCVVGAPGAPSGTARCTASGWSSVASCGTLADVNGQCGGLGNTPCISGTFSPGAGLTWRCLGSGNGSDANCGIAASGCNIGGVIIPPGEWHVFGGANCMRAECSCSNVLTTSRPSLCPNVDSIGTNTVCTGNPPPTCAPNQIAQCSVPLSNGTCTGTWSCQTVAQCGASNNQCALGNLQDVADTSTARRWDCVYGADTTVRDNCSEPRGSVNCVGDTVLYTGPACTSSGPGATIDQCSRAGACEGSNKVYRGCDNSVVQTIANDPSCAASCPSVSAQSVDGNARSGQVLPGALPSTTTQYVCNGYNVSQAGCNASGNCGTATCQASGNWQATTSCSGTPPSNASCGSASGGTYSSPPLGGLCADGQTPTVGQNATQYTWTCPGTSGGTSANCTANRSTSCSPLTFAQKQSVCNGCSGGASQNGNGGGACNVVSGDYCQFEDVDDSTIYYEHRILQHPASHPSACQPYLGPRNNFTTPTTSTNGSCGTAANSCVSGTSINSGFTPPNTSTWQCQGMNGGSTANCSATVTITTCSAGEYMTSCGQGADGCNCVPCTGNTIVNASQSGCVACPSGQTPNANHTACVTSTSYTYSWNTGTWGSCSASCGGGTQTRSVTCRRSDGATVADGNCSGTKPTTSQSCNTQSCGGGTITCSTVQWDFDGWCENTPSGQPIGQCNLARPTLCGGRSDCTVTTVNIRTNTCSKCDGDFRVCSSGFTGGGGTGGGTGGGGTGGGGTGGGGTGGGGTGGGLPPGEPMCGGVPC